MKLIKKIFELLFTACVYVIKALDWLFKFITGVIMFLACVAGLNYIGELPQPTQGIVLNILIFGFILFFLIFFGSIIFNASYTDKIWKKIMKK
ncbi:hypothetical protein C4565_02425 [Candidatus Parcubacteria bacterium]|nr:MAG: hypothetical protein C4565_02425 [Candidatus Parcubacteria bacterium]